ncbi:hypothetical protein [Albidovulum salinarum]|nr:hypothetical protein [Defluviimonas sp. WL0024]
MTAIPDETADPPFEPGLADHTSLEPEGAQKAADVILDDDRLSLKQLPGCQQGPPLLASPVLHVFFEEQVHSHYLDIAPGIVAIGLVDLILRKGLRVTGFDADHRKAHRSQSAVEPLRQGIGFQPDPYEVNPFCSLGIGEILRLPRNLGLAAILTQFIDDTHRRFLHRNVQISIVLHSSCFLADVPGCSSQTTSTIRSKRRSRPLHPQSQYLFPSHAREEPRRRSRRVARPLGHKTGRITAKWSLVRSGLPASVTDFGHSPDAVTPDHRPMSR